jgi:Xaa-Pro dipeptidase
MESNNSPNEFETRLKGLIQIMEQERLEGILIYSNMLRRENIRYFTNFNPIEPDALALFSLKGEGMLLLPIGTEEIRAKSTSWVKTISSFDGDLSKAIDLSKKMHIQKRVGVAGWEYTPLNLIIQIKKTFPNVKLVNVTPLVHRIRAIKSEAEIQRIEKAAQIADSAFGYLVENLKPGMKEYEIIALTEISFLPRSHPSLRAIMPKSAGLLSWAKYPRKDRRPTISFLRRSKKELKMSALE